MLKKVEKKTENEKKKTKSIFRIAKNKDNPYVMLNKESLNNKNLSWKAKGILAYLLSLPDDWQIYEEEIQTHSKDGLDSLRSGIKELIENGYIERVRMRDEKGMLKGYEYSVYETSIQIGKSKIGKSKTGKSKATNNNLTNNNLTNNKDDDDSPQSGNKIVPKDLVEEVYQKAVKTLGEDLANTVLDRAIKAFDKNEEKGIVVNDPIAYFNMCVENEKNKVLVDLDKDVELQKVKKKLPKKKEPVENSMKKRTKFDNFEAREYDYVDLEKKLLGWDN